MKNVIAISYAKQVFKAGSRERERMERYASKLGEYHIIVFTRANEGYESETHSGNLHLYATNSSSKLGMLFDARKIAERVLTENTDRDFIVSAQDPFECAFVALKAAKHIHATLHVQVHGSYFGSKYWKAESFLNTLRYRFGRKVLGEAVHIRVVSERIKKSLLALGIEEKKISVLPIRTEIDDFLKTTKIEHDGLVVLTAGRLSREKNISMLLNAANELKEKHPSARYRIIGSGREESKLKMLVESLGLREQVALIGWSDDLPREMAEADIYTLTSDHEGYALVLIEAMASELPVVTTDVGCVGEIVLDSIHGLVVAPQDQRAFTNALDRLLSEEDLRKQFARQGKETARKHALVSGDAYLDAWVASLG